MTDGSNAERDFLAAGLSRRATIFVALLFFVAALLFRLSGITWGLPTDFRHQSLHPDELLIEQTVNEPYFHPGFYNYGTLYLTALKLATDAGLAYGWIRKPQLVEGKSRTELLMADGAANWRTYRDIHLTGRVISAIAGAATVSIVFLTLLLFTGVLGASAGGLAMLIAPGHVVHSRFQTTDILATMLIALAIYLMLRLFQVDAGKRVRAVLIAGIVVGLATGTKYTGFLLLPSLLLALRFVDAGSFLKSGLIGLAGSSLGLFVATPGILLEPSAFWSGFLFELHHSAEGHGIVFANTTSGFVYHLWNLVVAFGLLPLLFGLLGLVFGIIRKEKWLLTAGLFAILYYVLIGRAEVKFMRYVLPLLPVLAVALGFVVGEFHKKGGYNRLFSGAAIIALGYSLISLQGAMQMTAFMNSKDPRDQAAEWLRDKNASVGLVSDPWFYSPSLFADIGFLDWRDRLGAMSLENPRVLRYLAKEGERQDWDVRLLTEMKPDYVVFSSFEFVDNDRINLPNLDMFVAELAKGYKIAAVFWGNEPQLPSQEDQSHIITRNDLRAIFSSKFPQVHDMMYIRPALCVFQKK